MRKKKKYIVYKKNFYNNRKKNFYKIIFYLFIFFFLSLLTFYYVFFSTNFNLKEGKSYLIQIPKGSGYYSFIDTLNNKNLISNTLTLKLSLFIYNFKYKIRPGQYLINYNESNFSLLRKIKNNIQSPTKLVINGSTSIKNLYEKIDKSFEFSEQELLKELENLRKINDDFNKDNYITIFIPNTYLIYWDIKPDAFVKRFLKEYNIFWSDEKRVSLLNKHPLKKEEIYILASILEKETNMDNEKNRIAGVYMNRLLKKQYLQADPTINFIFDFKLKRILNKHLTTKSKYNTYLNLGLPPGPICIPSVSSIDAVLNYEKHTYMFFCASDDLTGYHKFASTFSQHLINAKKFRKVLNKLNLFE